MPATKTPSVMSSITTKTLDRDLLGRIANQKFLTLSLRLGGRLGGTLCLGLGGFGLRRLGLSRAFAFCIPVSRTLRSSLPLDLLAASALGRFDRPALRWQYEKHIRWRSGS